MSHTLLVGGGLVNHSCKVNATSLPATVPRRKPISLANIVVHSSSSVQLEETTESSDGIQRNAVRYGIVTAQGPRETMEDVAYVIERGPCGFLFASTL